MRQAEESEIIRLSMHVRAGNPIETFQSTRSEVCLVSPHEVVTGMYDWADQILCATNARRNNINTQMRALKGFDPNFPCTDDKIISLRNHWECYTHDGHMIPMTNGSIAHLTTFEQDKVVYPRHLKLPTVDIIKSTIQTEDGIIYPDIDIDLKCLLTGEKTLTPEQEYAILKKTAYGLPYEFAYGYAITVHKAQGSSWEKVLVFEERFPFSKVEHARHLYTAITRAEEKIVLVKNK